MRILDLLFVLSSKPVVVTMACVGAALVSLAPLSKRFQGKRDDNTETATSPRPRIRIEDMLTRAGYGIMGISVVLFIIAGFISDLA
jgi:hypothetical protein